jgi:hypothetical protein
MTTRPIFTERGTFSEAFRVPVNDACAVIPLEDRGITENATEDSVRYLQVRRKRISPRAVYGANSEKMQEFLGFLWFNADESSHTNRGSFGERIVSWKTTEGVKSQKLTEVCAPVVKVDDT